MISVKVLPLSPKLTSKAKRLGVQKRLGKAIKLFESNPFYPGLNTELLEPKQMGIWSFRVDRKVRVLFFFRDDKQSLTSDNLKKAIEIINITVHYH